MGKLVLPIGGAKAQPTERLDDLGVQPGNTGFKCRLLTGLNNVAINFALLFGEYFSIYAG